MQTNLRNIAIAALAALAASGASAAGTHAGDHGHGEAIGKPGAAAKAARTVDVDMTDGMRFNPSGGAAPSAGGTTTATAAELSEGEVRKVDKDGKKLTLKHGPLKNLDMPAMTMVFQVKEEAMLDKIQAGDKVRFQAEKVDGKFTVIRLEAAR